MMKNIMIVDGADNCAYEVFAATEEEFSLFFPDPGQDIAFIDEISGPGDQIDEAFQRLWLRPLDKKTIAGLHGMIFCELELKKQYYPNRRDSDLTDNRSRAAR